MERKPAIKISNEITPAKMGRSTKNLDMFMIRLPADGFKLKNVFKNKKMLYSGCKNPALE
jgi:hypothetical protein